LAALYNVADTEKLRRRARPLVTKKPDISIIKGAFAGLGPSGYATTPLPAALVCRKARGLPESSGPVISYTPPML
jgi:hypothetical protein